MSDLETNTQNSRQDAMDGGFAVVDRERLIEEEIQNITPWYKHFIHVFTAPGKMMEECLAIEPTKANSVGFVGAILFTVVTYLISFLNPATKLATYDALRAAGIEEAALQQRYSITMIGGTISGVIMIFILALISALLFQLMKVILRDRCKFTTIYKMLLLATMVTMAIQCVDTILACILGVSGSIFSVNFLLNEATKQTALGMVLVSTLTLQNVVGIVFMVLGYKVITHTTIKKGILAVGMIQIISIAATYFYSGWQLSMQAALMK